MFEGKYESDIPKLPTLIQYCKQHPLKAEKGVKIITFIWLPNQFDSICFDTEVFRLRITSKADFYEALLRQLSDWEEKEAVPMFRITSAKHCAYILDELPGEKADWIHVGEFGRKISIQERRSTKKRASQNPASLREEQLEITWPNEP